MDYYRVDLAHGYCQIGLNLPLINHWLVLCRRFRLIHWLLHYFIFIFCHQILKVTKFIFLFFATKSSNEQNWYLSRPRGPEDHASKCSHFAWQRWSDLPRSLRWRLSVADIDQSRWYWGTEGDRKKPPLPSVRPPSRRLVCGDEEG